MTREQGPPARTVRPEDFAGLDEAVARELEKGRDVVDERSGHEHVRYNRPGSTGVPVTFLTDARPGAHGPLFSPEGRRILHMLDGPEG